MLIGHLYESDIIFGIVKAFIVDALCQFVQRQAFDFVFGFVFFVDGTAGRTVSPGVEQLCIRNTAVQMIATPNESIEPFFAGKGANVVRRCRTKKITVKFLHIVFVDVLYADVP